MRRDHQTKQAASIILLAMVLTACVTLTGCETTTASSRQLARVAKDWCLTIRASQVIPVYPLTEDVQPGDVFLVRTTIDEQIRVYEQMGFLPLENLITRQELKGYATFYQNSFGIAGHTNTPHHWQFPDNPTVTNGWAVAPLAGFPSYTFSVERGAGLSLAVPVHGVPVALSLLGAGKAHGSVELSDAYTYGLDMQSVERQVDAWARKSVNKDFLKQFEPKDGRTNYIRIVNRVYLAKTVNVSVVSDETSGATISGGAPKPVNLFDLTTENGSNSMANTSNYVALVSALATQLDTALPGGTLKLAAASGRSISMVETFPRPLVFGYIAFDQAIVKDGGLDLPKWTYGRLTRARVSEGTRNTWAKTANQIEQIVAYCNDGHDTVDGSKLKTLTEGTGLAASADAWVKNFDNKSVAVLQTDLEGDDYEYVAPLAKGVPAMK